MAGNRTTEAPSNTRATPAESSSDTYANPQSRSSSYASKEMSSDDLDDELRDFQNGDSSSDGDSVRLHGDGRTLRTPGLLEVDDLLCDDHLPELVEGNLKKLPTLDTILSSESDGRESESNTQEPSKSHKKATVARSTTENRQRYTTGVAGQE
ncbi:hypothetical protein BJV82DRAFT_640113 [Fennellomyces sp. T-0311]|nr:hypothetical protein BJV82DRAFT_640113 [Fennellomyces sp. T-0311]